MTDFGHEKSYDKINLLPQLDYPILVMIITTIASLIITIVILLLKYAVRNGFLSSARFTRISGLRFSKH